jgi:hypothetical protein
MKEPKAIVLVRDAALASSLELALFAAGVTPSLFPLTEPVERLPLEGVGTAIIGPCPPSDGLELIVKALRARSWDGLIVLITGDPAKLGPGLCDAPGVAVLEMPFVGADLVAVIRAGRSGTEPTA